MDKYKCIGILILNDPQETVDLLIMDDREKNRPLLAGENANPGEQGPTVMQFLDDPLSDPLVPLADDVRRLGVLRSDRHDHEVDHLAGKIQLDNGKQSSLKPEHGESRKNDARVDKKQTGPQIQRSILVQNLGDDVRTPVLEPLRITMPMPHPRSTPPKTADSKISILSP